MPEVRRVRTPEGARKYGQRIGSIIKPDLPETVSRIGRKPEWDPDLPWEQNSERDRAWKRSVRTALSLGQLTHQKAEELGYRPTGHDSRSNVYRNGVPAGGWQALPPILYHATTAASGVRARGLLSRDDLAQENGLGLGGGESDTISFTVDQALAEHIRDAILEMRQVVRGDITVAEMLEQARRGDRAREPYFTNLMRHWDRDWQPGDDLPLGVQSLLEGNRYSRGASRNAPAAFSTVAEVEEQFPGAGWEPVDEGRDAPKGRLHFLWRRPLTEDERMDNAAEFYKVFTQWREFHGGPPNPVFFSSNTAGLADIDPDEVEVLRFRPRPGAQGYPVSGMGEWRTVSGEAVELEEIPPTVAALTPEQDTNLQPLRDHPVNRLLGQKFAEAGHPLFLVGGSVRDALAGHPDFADLDYTTDATPDEIHAVVDSLGPTWGMGEQFGTVGIQIEGLKTEVTTFRTERYDEDSRKPVVDYGDNILDDLRRRDLTMNAMALTLASDGVHPIGTLVDPHGGAKDLAAGLLRTPDDPAKSMSEDPLRQLRVVRFAAKREAEPEPGLRSAIQNLNDRLSIISPERKTAELRKILEGGPATTLRAMEMAEDLGVADDLFGGLATGPRARRTMSLFHEWTDPVTQLAALAYHTEDNPARLMSQMRLSNEEARPALDAAVLATKMSGPGDAMDARALIRKADRATLDRARHVGWAAGGRGPLRERVDEVLGDPDLVETLRGPLPVDGNDLVAAGLSGPEVGRALARITEAFLANPQLTRTDALRIAKAETKTSRPSPPPRPALPQFLGSLSNLAAVEKKGEA